MHVRCVSGTWGGRRSRNEPQSRGDRRDRREPGRPGCRLLPAATWAAVRDRGRERQSRGRVAKSPQVSSASGGPRACEMVVRCSTTDGFSKCPTSSGARATRLISAGSISHCLPVADGQSRTAASSSLYLASTSWGSCSSTHSARRCWAESAGTPTHRRPHRGPTGERLGVVVDAVSPPPFGRPERRLSESKLPSIQPTGGDCTLRDGTFSCRRL